MVRIVFHSGNLTKYTHVKSMTFISKQYIFILLKIEFPLENMNSAEKRRKHLNESTKGNEMHLIPGVSRPQS